MRRPLFILTLLFLGACVRVTAPLDALSSPSAALVTWGSDALGQADVSELPAGLRYTQIAAGSVHSLALRSDGQISAWGNYGDSEIPELPQGLRYTAVAAGGQARGVALRSDGTVVAWDAYSQGKVPDLPAGFQYTAVAAGENHDLALRSDGQLVAWGDTSHGQTVVPVLPAGLRYTAAAGGRGHSLALRSDGLIAAWGDNSEGQVEVPSLPTGLRYTAVAAGSAHSLALRSDGRVVAWGDNDYGQTVVPQLPLSVMYKAIAGGLDFSLALRSDGRIVAWGDGSSGQLEVPPLAAGERYVALAAGGSHALALEESVQRYRADTVGAPLNGTLWRVQVGKGVSYLGNGSPNRAPIAVTGTRYSKGTLLAGNVARVVAGKFTVVQPGTNTPNPAGGSLSFTFPSSFGRGSGAVRLETLQVSGVSKGTYVLLRADGRVVRRLELDPKLGKIQTVRLSQEGVQALNVVALAAFSLDDILFSD